MTLEENWPWGFREVVQMCGRTDDGRQVITISYPEPCSGELKIDQSGEVDVTPAPPPQPPPHLHPKVMSISGRRN